MNPTSRAWVDVDLGAFRRNLLRVRESAPGAEVVPMLKADAYGLGMEAILGAAREALAPHGGPWAVGVAAVAEGEALRRFGWTGRAVVFSPVPPDEMPRAAAAGLALSISSVAALERWAALAREAGRRLPFHLEIDTGMGRAGLPCGAVDQWGPRIAEVAGDLLAWEGCYTHFHSADEPDLSSADAQQRRFEEALRRLPPAPGGASRVVHSANSAAAVRRRGYGMDLVRPGIFLYGGSAGPGAVPEPVAAIRARVGLVREVEPGATCGYGATHTARRRERWATLAIGYGDGLPRALGATGGEALLHGRRVPIVGRISMDVTVVDVTGLPGVREGDAATLVGADGEEEILVDDVAARVGTISYEVLTGLTPRLPRVHR